MLMLRFFLLVCYPAFIHTIQFTSLALSVANINFEPVVANAVTALVTGVFRDRAKRPKSYYRYVVMTMLRTFTRKASVRQQKYVCFLHLICFYFV